LSTKKTPAKNGKPAPANGQTPAPAVPTLDTEAFRRKLVGLVDPLGPRAGAAGRENLKSAASRLCVILAKLYAVSDDRTKLWEHVGKAIQVADEKTSDDDVEHFVSECLALVSAEPGLAAADEDLGSLLSEMVGWPPEHRHDWLNYLRSHRYSVLTFGRQKWEEHKAANAARRAERKAKS
jgi:hypothetical protein